MGLGSFGRVTLAEARERASEARKLVGNGVDPIEARKALPTNEPTLPTFAAVAGWYIEAHRAGWTNPKHAAQWGSTLSEDDGGGYVATVPDLPGCTADGETAEAALIAARDAIDAWMEAAKAEGRSITKPGSGVCRVRL